MEAAGLIQLQLCLSSRSRRLLVRRYHSRNRWEIYFIQADNFREDKSLSFCYPPATNSHTFSATNKPVNFTSFQQLLDCTYEDQSYDACNGGWYYTAWDYIIKNGNKLARESDYRYRNSDGSFRRSFVFVVSNSLTIRQFASFNLSEIVNIPHKQFNCDIYPNY